MQPWKRVAGQTDSEIATTDVVVLNLYCADGLPGSQHIDIRECVRIIDDWTAKVNYHTQKNVRHFRRHPNEYNNSFAHFCALVMVSILQRHCGISYNPEKMSPDVPFDIEDTFLHGITHGAGGTCASLPVLYLAVGRRLGYPLRLVIARGPKYSHQFVRWDDSKGERFNIETTCSGLSCHPDDYYRTGFYESTKRHEKHGCLLKSLSRREELAQFLMQRACAFLELKDYRNAADACGWASALAPGNQLHLRAVEDMMEKWEQQIKEMAPPGSLRMNFTMTGRIFPRSLRRDIEQAIRDYQIQQSLLNDPELEKEFWTPMRRGRIPQRRLNLIDVTHDDQGSKVFFHFSENRYTDEGREN